MGTPHVPDYPARVLVLQPAVSLLWLPGFPLSTPAVPPSCLTSLLVLYARTLHEGSFSIASSLSVASLLPSLLPHKQTLDFPFLAQVFRRPAQNSTSGENGASRVDSCSPRSRAKENRGREQPPLSHGIAPLPASSLWSILEPGAPLLWQPGPRSPTRCFGEGQFYPERTETQKGCVTVTGGRGKRRKRPWPGSDRELLWPPAHCVNVSCSVPPFPGVYQFPGCTHLSRRY